MVRSQHDELGDHDQSLPAHREENFCLVLQSEIQTCSGGRIRSPQRRAPPDECVRGHVGRIQAGMSKVRIAAFSVSIHGFGAGPRQDLQNPLGVRGAELHGWFFHTDIFKKMQGEGDGAKSIDNVLLKKG